MSTPKLVGKNTRIVRKSANDIAGKAIIKKKTNSTVSLSRSTTKKITTSAISNNSKYSTEKLNLDNKESFEELPKTDYTYGDSGSYIVDNLKQPWTSPNMSRRGLKRQDTDDSAFTVNRTERRRTVGGTSASYRYASMVSSQVEEEDDHAFGCPLDHGTMGDVRLKSSPARSLLLSGAGSRSSRRTSTSSNTTPRSTDMILRSECRLRGGGLCGHTECLEFKKRLSRGLVSREEMERLGIRRTTITTVTTTEELDDESVDNSEKGIRDAEERDEYSDYEEVEDRIASSRRIEEQTRLLNYQTQNNAAQSVSNAFSMSLGGPLRNLSPMFRTLVTAIRRRFVTTEETESRIHHAYGLDTAGHTAVTHPSIFSSDDSDEETSRSRRTRTTTRRRRDSASSNNSRSSSESRRLRGRSTTLETRRTRSTTSSTTSQGASRSTVDRQFSFLTFVKQSCCSIKNSCCIVTLVKIARFLLGLLFWPVFFLWDSVVTAKDIISHCGFMYWLKSIPCYLKRSSGSPSYSLLPFYVVYSAFSTVSTSGTRLKSAYSAISQGSSLYEAFYSCHTWEESWRVYLLSQAANVDASLIGGVMSDRRSSRRSVRSTSLVTQEVTRRRRRGGLGCFCCCLLPLLLFLLLLPLLDHGYLFAGNDTRASNESSTVGAVSQSLAKGSWWLVDTVSSGVMTPFVLIGSAFEGLSTPSDHKYKDDTMDIKVTDNKNIDNDELSKLLLKLQNHERRLNDHDTWMDKHGKRFSVFSESFDDRVKSIINIEINEIHTTITQLSSHITSLTDRIFSVETSGANTLAKAEAASSKADEALTLARQTESRLSVVNQDELAALSKSLSELRSIVHSEKQAVETKLLNLEGSYSSLALTLQSLPSKTQGVEVVQPVYKENTEDTMARERELVSRLEKRQDENRAADREMASKEARQLVADQDAKHQKQIEELRKELLALHGRLSDLTTGEAKLKEALEDINKKQMELKSTQESNVVELRALYASQNEDLLVQAVDKAAERASHVAKDSVKSIRREDLILILGDYGKESTSPPQESSKVDPTTLTASLSDEDRKRLIEEEMGPLIESRVASLRAEMDLKVVRLLQERQITLQSNSYSGGSVEDSHISMLIRQALELFAADRLGLPDFALESAGGSIVGTRCTRTYNESPAIISLFGFPILKLSRSARTLIEASSQPGECWAFHGSKGQAVIQLATSINITAVTLEHIPASLAPNQKIESAPKDFIIRGLHNERDMKGFVLGNFTYVDAGPAIQTFPIIQIPRPFEFVELDILTNHGNPRYTCVYRLRVHGVPHLEN